MKADIVARHAHGTEIAARTLRMAVALRFGRIVEANLEPGELALADLALGDDPRKPYGNDGPTVAELTGATRNPGAQHFQTLVLAAPAVRDRELEADKAFGGSASRRLPN